MNQTFKDFFDAVEYIILRLLLLGLLGMGAWALLGHAFDMRAAPEQQNGMTAIPSLSSGKSSRTHYRKRRKKKSILRPQLQTQYAVPSVR
jgi:hypothetical protein